MKWSNQSDSPDQKIGFGVKTERGLLCSVKVEEICKVFSLVLQWETFPQKNWWKRRNGWMRKKTKKKFGMKRWFFTYSVTVSSIWSLFHSISDIFFSLKPPPWPKLRRQDPQHRRSTTIDALIHNITHSSNSNRTQKNPSQPIHPLVKNTTTADPQTTIQIHKNTQHPNSSRITNPTPKTSENSTKPTSSQIQTHH